MYFEIKVQAKSAEELAKRVADNVTTNNESYFRLLIKSTRGN